MAAIGGNPGRVDWYYGQGARLGMLTWNETNALAAGAGGDPQAGLTEADAGGAPDGENWGWWWTCPI